MKKCNIFTKNWNCLLAVVFVVGMVAMAVSPAQATVIPVNAPTPQTVLTMNIVTSGLVNYNVNGTAHDGVTIESQAAGTFLPVGASLRPGIDGYARWVQPTSSGDTYGIYYHFQAVPGQVFTSFTFDPAQAVNVGAYNESYKDVYVHWDVSTDGLSYTELARGDNSNPNYWYNHIFGTLNAFPAVGTNPTDIYIKAVGHQNGNSSAANLFGWDVIPSPYQLDNLLTVTAQTQAMAGTPYENWALANAGGGTPGEDSNNDGVQNGVAYFMGMTGLATNPGVVNGKVTWPHVGTVASWEVQVSDDLAIWNTASTGVDVSDPSKVVFTLPTGAAKKFCRLLVIP